eukprot:7623218-Alexandrium_andersonii.AAC.1
MCGGAYISCVLWCTWHPLHRLSRHGWSPYCSRVVSHLELVLRTRFCGYRRPLAIWTDSAGT